MSNTNRFCCTKIDKTDLKQKIKMYEKKESGNENIVKLCV